MDRFPNPVYLILAVAIGLNCCEGMRLAHSFTVKDTRTEAKEWIDKHVPQGSKIIIDSKTNSPPLLMSYGQIKRMAERAASLNNYKKEYLALKLEAHPGEGFEILTLKKAGWQVGSLQHQVDAAEQVQDLQSVSGDLEALRKKGIYYAITNDDITKGYDPILDKDIYDFYQALENEATMINMFIPSTNPFHNCGVIRVYLL